jgi:hypothetical protein
LHLHAQLFAGSIRAAFQQKPGVQLLAHGTHVGAGIGQT